MVQITINEAQFHSLPPKVTEMFRIYGTHLRGPNRDTLCIELPEYRWQEIRDQIPKHALGA